MADTYPYVISNGKVAEIFDKIKTAAKPDKFTHEFFKKLGFSSSNDRAVIPLLKRLGFLTEDGGPTEYYDRLKDPTDQAFVLGERIKSLYADVYSVNTTLHDAKDEEMKGAFARVTGKDATAVARYVATFKTLVNLAKFGQSPSVKQEQPLKEIPIQNISPNDETHNVSAEFHYNIQIHLPATTEVSVYNAIFKSLKDNLL